MDFSVLSSSRIPSIAVLLPLLAFMQGCSVNTYAEKITLDKTVMPTECGGWEKIDLKKRTSLFLMREDPRLIVEIDSHNLKGQNLGCWQ
ncbi:hypothetical protein ACI0FR_00106 [Paenochrobactrum sp. BZR 201-1]